MYVKVFKFKKIKEEGWESDVMTDEVWTVGQVVGFSGTMILISDHDKNLTLVELRNNIKEIDNGEYERLVTELSGGDKLNTNGSASIGASLVESGPRSGQESSDGKVRSLPTKKKRSTWDAKGGGPKEV